MMFAFKSLAQCCAVAALLCSQVDLLSAQSKREKEEQEILKTPKDPHTKADPERMKQAGVVAYQPFLWSPRYRTTDVDRVLGEKRILWMETDHFVIGSTLLGCPMPEKSDERKQLYAELAELRKKLPKLPKRPRRLDPWLRVHLYAHRAEKLYAEFAEMVGAPLTVEGVGKPPPNGPYLGMTNKFQILLFQKKSDLARYLDRFLNMRADHAYRYYVAEDRLMMFASALDIGEDKIRETGFHGHFLYMMAHNMVAGYRQYNNSVPHWLAEGIAHYYSRKVETDFINVEIRDSDAVNQDDQHEWQKKVRARARHDGATVPFAKMCEWEDWDKLNYQDHIQSWSRLDFLMSLSPQSVGALLGRIKEMPMPPNSMGVDPALILAVKKQALMELFELDEQGFDDRWRAWVKKAYRKY
ncbi:MAG: hypothetical protein VYE77_02855 [Planctomycetota bacterium]|nr:hypothetical protein [Planctomycetota bacterium]